MQMSRKLSNTAASFSGRSITPQLRPEVSHFHNSSYSRKSQKQLSTLICQASLEGNLVRSRFPGFDDEEVTSREPQLVTPESASWGLSVSQMKAMGIASAADRTGNLDPVRDIYNKIALLDISCILYSSLKNG